MDSLFIQLQIIYKSQLKKIYPYLWSMVTYSKKAWLSKESIGQGKKKSAFFTLVKVQKYVRVIV